MTASRLVGLRECCQRLDMSYRTAKRRLAAGTFPVPAQPRRSVNEPYKFSTVHIESYLAESALDDARVVRRSRRERPAPPRLAVVPRPLELGRVV